MNQNLFDIGLAMSYGLVILSLGSVILSPIVHESDTEFIKRVAHQRYITGLFLLGWSWASLYLVWFAIIFPKPKEGSFI